MPDCELDGDAAALGGEPVSFQDVNADAGRKTAAVLAVTTLALSNVVTNRWLPKSAYVPWNLTLATGLVTMARAVGHSVEDIGLHPARLRGGARIGGGAALLVGTGYAALLRSGKAQRVLSDRRLSDLTTRGFLWRLLVQIPLGTAVAEEIAFRGVLPLFLDDPRRPAWASPLMASTLFGLWHLLPAREEANANARRSVPAMAVTAMATTLAGGVLHRLRTRAGHVAAPIALHFATNGLGLLAVRMADSRR